MESADLDVTTVSSLTLRIVAFVAFGSLLIAVFSATQLFISEKHGDKVLRGPFRFPLLGNSLQLLFHYYHRLEYLMDCTKKYGEVFRFNILNSNCIMISNPTDVEYVLQTNFSNFVKGGKIYARLSEFLGNGIFNADGHLWKLQRKTYSYMFTVKLLRDEMTGVFQHHGKIYLEQIKKRQGEYFDIQKLNFQFTMDSIAEIAFGFKVRSLEDDAAPFALAFDKANQATEFRLINPLWRLTRWLLPIEKSLRDNVVLLDRFAEDVINFKRKMINEGKSSGTDMLSRFMHLRDENGEPYADKYLRDAILSIVLAGRDTTAGLLTWAAYEMCQHPEVQEKLIQEIDEVLKGELPDYESMKSLKYMDSFLHETLRLHPQVPIELKQTVNDDVLPSGYRVKKDEMIIFLPYVMNRSEKLWENPLEFRPERWFTTRPTAFQFPTFLAGPRICLGQTMAYLEATIALAMLLQNFTLSLKPNQHITYNVSLTMPVRGELLISATPRH